MRRLIGRAFVSGHISLILWVCVSNTILLIADGHTFLPNQAQQVAKRIELAIGAEHARHATGLTVLDQISAAYLHAAGIDTGYGFFAPAVPSPSKLVFEIFYDDGHVEYELPVVNNEAVGLRLSTFLSQLAQIRYDPLRELIMRMLAYSEWQRHPTAQRIRAVVGFVRLAPPGEPARENAADYQFQYAYDFTFGPN